MPRVSVVIPLYQTERYIEAALASVLAQTFTDFEVLVIDDGSTDRGPQIARETGDPRVHVISQDNRGLAGARNTGIRHAKGDFIAFLDADDLWMPDKLARHIEHFSSDPSIDVSFCASSLIDERGQALGLRQSPLGTALDEEVLFCRNPIGNGSVPVIRRRALARIEHDAPKLGRTCWFDESFRQSEDIECWMRLKVIGRARFGYVADALTLYRVNGEGLSANVDQQLATWRRFRDRVERYAPDLVARCGRRAEAYQLRYLARRVIRSSEREQGLALMLEALRLHPKAIVEEPVRTVSTLLAAMAKRWLPAGAFASLQRGGMRAASVLPGLRF